MNYRISRQFDRMRYMARLCVTCGFIAINIFGLLTPDIVSADEVLDAQVVSFSYEDMPNLLVGKIQIISVLKLHAVEFNNQEMVELSGLAWSEDEGILYAISDHGSVFHFKPEFAGNELSDIELINAYPLRDSDGDPQTWPKNDSEGLFALNTFNGVSGDDELLVSYELAPRIQRHDVSGVWKGKLNLPEYIEDIGNYRGKNKALEAVTVHPEFGVLTVPERPLESEFNNNDYDKIILYALSGKQWAMPVDNDDLSVVAIETMPDGRLLLLRRQHRFIGESWTVVLDRLQLYEDGQLEQERLGELISGGDVFPVDNFEGLAHHRGNRYFMVSDDNEHALQATLLVYFEVLD